MNKSSDKRFVGKKILLLEGYTRQSLPFLREFKKLGCETTILCNSKGDCAYWSNLPDHKILGVCNRDNPEATEKYMIELIKNGGYDLVLPLFDFSARIMSKNKVELSKYAKIHVNDWDVFQIANDKLAVMKYCQENGIPCAKTLFDAKTLDDVKNSDIPYPVFMKPRSDAGAKGAHIFNSFEEMKKCVEERGINIAEQVIQECLPIDSLVMSNSFFIDQNGEVKSMYQHGCYRFYPLTGGTGTFDITFNRPDIHADSTRLVQGLGMKGTFAVDLMIDSRDNVGKVIEINPRPLAPSVIGFHAGVNQALQILEMEFLGDVKPQMEYKVDTRIRMMQIDVLWFLKSPERFKCKPSWFSWKNTHEQTFYWSDPLPWFAFLLGGIFRYKSEMKKRT